MRTLPLLLPIALALPAMAQAEPQQERTVIALVVYGDDPCPREQGDAIVVCARKPEAERYRIPKKLRDKVAPQGGPGWASQVAMMEAAGRAVTPGSCSAVGSYGATGCTAAMLQQWFAERRMQQSEGVP